LRSYQRRLAHQSLQPCFSATSLAFQSTRDRVGSQIAPRGEQRWIESPAEGEKATVVGVGVKDDPVSREMIEMLAGTAGSGA
jgi:hypothetical protein